LIYFQRAIQALTDPALKLTKKDASISHAKKTIAIGADQGTPTIKLTNEYGNTISYSIDANQFDSLFGSLWQFVKDSQH
jgi:hypothetical protein